MDFIETEIDYYDKTTCPFNKNHRLSQTEKFKHHLSQCKDIQVIHECIHNRFHIFADTTQLSYHIPRCPDHPLRSPLVNGIKCPNNPNHMFVSES